jgi:hypothetical protein
MRSACERLPVELWHQIIRDALKSARLVDIEDHTQDQYTFEQKFRLYNGHAQRRVQQEQECTRRCLRGVCHSWQALTDLTLGGWVKITNMIDKETLYTPGVLTAWHIDCSLIPESGPSGRQLIRDGDEINTLETVQYHKARILTINSGLCSIDSFIQNHGHLFPSLQVLDLRPASTILTPSGGVLAGPNFFATLSTLFPSLSILLVDVPASSASDVLSFPRLRRLSYNIIGQARLSDWQRCVRIAEWTLPMIEHVSLNPVGCVKDWELVVSAMRAWGAGLKSLCWDAEFPDGLGITIGATDWSACSGLIDFRYNTSTVRRESGSGDITGDAAGETPAWHPFHQIQICRGEDIISDQSLVIC